MANSAYNLIKRFNSQELGEALLKKGYYDLGNIILNHDVDGEHFLENSEFHWRTMIGRSNLKILWPIINELKNTPCLLQHCIDSKTQTNCRTSKLNLAIQSQLEIKLQQNNNHGVQKCQIPQNLESKNRFDIVTRRHDAITTNKPIHLVSIHSVIEDEHMYEAAPEPRSANDASKSQLSINANDAQCLLKATSKSLSSLNIYETLHSHSSPDESKRVSGIEFPTKPATHKKKLPLPPPINTIVFPEDVALFSSSPCEGTKSYIKDDEDEDGYLLASEIQDKHDSADENVYEQVSEGNSDLIRNFITCRTSSTTPPMERNNALKLKHASIQNIPLPPTPIHSSAPSIQFNSMKCVYLENHRESIPNKYQTIPRNKVPREHTSNDITMESYYRNTDKKGANMLLCSLTNGAFLIRPSSKYKYALNIKYKHKIFNVGIYKSGKYFECTTSNNTEELIQFDTVEDIVAYYKLNPLYLKDGDTIVEIYLKDLLEPHMT